MENKKEFKIVYTETLIHHFYVEAETEEEAKKEFERQLNNGEIDFSYGTLEDSKIEVGEN